MLSRRIVLGTGAAILSTPALAARPLAGQPFPTGFLWGAATAPYQIEGNDTAADLWLLEQVRPTLFVEKSGDACDSYNRFREDITLLAGLGLNSYRFGIEWARIEPIESAFSNAQLDHYALMIDLCRRAGVKPLVTFSHFSTPTWFAARGGFEADDSPDLFARYCRRAAGHLGGMIELASTFNEANAPMLLRSHPKFAHYETDAPPMLAAAARACGSSRFSSVLFTDPKLTEANMIEAHRLGYEAIKAAQPKLPVGITLSIQDVVAVGDPSGADAFRKKIYGGWLDAARSHSDYIGVQTYIKLRVGADGLLPPDPGGNFVAGGVDFNPSALEGAIRWTHRTLGKPIYVTENGLVTADDQRRVAYIDRVLPGVLSCIRDGIPVRGYVHWSLLDNFEWDSGYGPHYGLFAVDRDTFRRTAKPSASHLGAIAQANALL